MNKKIIGFLGGISLLLSVVTLASAHVVVKPQEAGVGAFQTFTIGVPNEKENSTVSLRLIIPEGLNYVSPNVKPGWTITVKKIGGGDTEKVTEIEWTGGTIPEGQRDDFLFSAQVPASEATIDWKAYQTYEDGTIVSWDQDPNAMKDMSEDDKEKMEKEGKGPFSKTTIVDDLKVQEKATQESSPKTANMLSIVALVLSILAIAMQLKKSKE